MTFSTPKISVTPDAIRNSSMPMIMPLVSWVTTHDAVPSAAHQGFEIHGDSQIFLPAPSLLSRHMAEGWTTVP